MREPLVCPIAEANFPEPFSQGLEFNAPVRGPWNIVHMALKVPEAHLLYICARGCLRGVLMTAYEMGAQNRMSWVGVQEEDLAGGLLEEVSLESITEIIASLSPTPPCIFLYLSCIHKFSHFDYPRLLQALQERFPKITFIDCHMMPTMRKSGPNDEQRTREKMYACLQENGALEERSVNTIGNDFLLPDDSLIVTLFKKNGFVWRDVSLCKDYAAFLDLAKSKYNVTTHPDAFLAAETLSKRLGQTHIAVPLSYSATTIREHLAHLCHALDIPFPHSTIAMAQEESEFALAMLQKTLGSRPIALDYTFTPRPLGLARLLTEAGLSVNLLFCDAFDMAEKEDFLWLQNHAPHLRIMPTLAPEMRFHALRSRVHGFSPEECLALGQKAAFFTETSHFVNMVGGGGLYDFTGITRLARLMEEANHTSLDVEKTIQLKGLGVFSCLGQCSPQTSWERL